MGIARLNLRLALMSALLGVAIPGVSFLTPAASAEHEAGRARKVAKKAKPVARRPRPRTPQLTWHRNYKLAEQAARTTSRPMLVYFTGSDWCSYCVKMKREILDSAAFTTWASKTVVLLEVDFPRRRHMSAEEKRGKEALARRYGVRGFPTVLVLDAKGRELARTGYRAGGPEAWVAAAQRALEPKQALRPARRDGSSAQAS